MIFVIGINKTGLSSINNALGTLGYDGYQWASPQVAYGILHKTIRADYLVDHPIMFDYMSFDYEFPNSKFIVTHRRDNDAWIASSKWQRQMMKGRRIKGHDSGLYELRMWGTHDFDVPTLLEVKEKHYQRIDEYFKDRPQDVLHMNIIEDGEGWEKLCPFLGKDIPTVPFPHKNKSTSDFKDIEL